MHHAGSVLLSSQMYREDERRRRELLLSEDMFAESTTEFESTNRHDELEEGEIAPILETTGSVDKSDGRLDGEKEQVEEDDTSEGEEEEGENLPRFSQYVPFLLRGEKRKRTHDESEVEEEEEIDSEDDVFDKEDITMKNCWIGEKEDADVWNSAKVEQIPQSRSKYVGMKPQPTKVVKPRIDNVQVIIFI